MQKVNADFVFGYYSRNEHEKKFDDFNRKVFLDETSKVPVAEGKIKMSEHAMLQEALNLIRKLDDKVEALSKRIEELES